MTDDQKQNGSDTNPGGGSDPLGIIGWEVAGKYIMKSYIGGGGFGEVYEGYNKNLPEQKLVFKFFKRVQSRDKFAKEAKILCMLDHPNISRVIDYLPDEGAVVVSFIDGKDGSSILKSTGALDEARFLKVARAMTDAIAFAHDKRIAHRDIKPGNIMFDKSGHVYLIDFGIAKEMGGDATKTAYVALTPLFAAPERQAGDQDYNPFLSDIYEMGVTLFNFATNDLPYRNPANPNIREWGGMASEKLSPEVRRILMKATHPNPKERYQSSREMCNEFKSIKQVYGGQKKKSVLPYLAAIIVLLAVAAYFGRNQITDFYHQITAKNEQAGKTGRIKEEIEGILGEKDTLISSTEPDSAAVAVADEAKEQTRLTEEETASPETGQEETKPVVKKEETKPPEPEPKIIETKKEVKEEAAEKKPEPVEKKEETAVTKVEPEKPVGEPKIEETKKEPPPPSEFALTFDITPEGTEMITLDGREGAVDSTYMLKPGSYNIAIIHHEFPIYKNRVRIADSDLKVSYDLGKEMASLDSVSLQISLNPPSDQHIIELSFNGRRHTLLEFPIWGMAKPKGEWLLQAGIFGISDDEQKKPKIDSIVVFPYGGGTHAVVKGAKGRLILGSVNSEPGETIPLLIFWSE